MMCVMEADGLDEDLFPTLWCHFLYSKGLKTMKEMFFFFYSAFVAHDAMCIQECTICIAQWILYIVAQINK